MTPPDVSAADASVPDTSVPAIRPIIACTIGQPVTDEYLPLLVEELAISGEDLRVPDWHKDDIDAGREFRVAIVGAGMSGLIAAHRLQQAGVPYVILEKND